jgi:hypothetical protein
LKIDNELLKEFGKYYSETEKKCGDTVARYNEFDNSISAIENFVISKMEEEKAKNSLLYFRYLQMILGFRELRFSLVTADYKNAVQVIRYYFESLVQAFYVDQKHSEAPLNCKIEVLSEISDKQDYFVNRILDRSKLDSRESLKKFYDDLNNIVHPSHNDFPSVDEMMKELKSLEFRIKPDEFSRVLETNKRMHDCTIYLIFKSFPELKQMANEDSTISKIMKNLDLQICLK